MGVKERRKGIVGELELAGKLTDRLGVKPIRRELSQSRDGGTDLIVGNVAIEVKRQENADLYKWLKQAEDGRPEGKLVAVAWRPSRRDWVVMLPFEDFVDLVRESL